MLGLLWLKHCLEGFASQPIPWLAHVTVEKHEPPFHLLSMICRLQTVALQPCTL